MTNPWMKKNPFMSMWLSAFNTAKRQARIATTKATQDVFDAWLGVKPAPKKRRKRR